MRAKDSQTMCTQQNLELRALYLKSSHLFTRSTVKMDVLHCERPCLTSGAATVCPSTKSEQNQASSTETETVGFLPSLSFRHLSLQPSDRQQSRSNPLKTWSRTNLPEKRYRVPRKEKYLHCNPHSRQVPPLHGGTSGASQIHIVLWSLREPI